MKGDKTMEKVLEKKNRMLEIFYRAMKGELLSVKGLAAEYGVSEKSISRDISEIKCFLSNSREIVGTVELKYDGHAKGYYLEFPNFLLSKELLAIMKMLIGCRGLSETELLGIITKLKDFTSDRDKTVLSKMIEREIYRYQEVNHDCGSVIDNIWKLTRCIEQQSEITILYFKMSRELVERRIWPIAIIFSEYYYYLIAYRCQEDDSQEKIWEPVFFRADRIVDIVEHRKKFVLDDRHRFDEGELRNKIHFMFPGTYRTIRFEFTGPSVQAVLDKIPTARIVEKRGNVKVIEAETYGTGINMFLLSQGSWVKVLEPKELADEMQEEIQKMQNRYQDKEIKK